jgi:hypothetical protein
LFKKIYQKI